MNLAENAKHLHNKKFIILWVILGILALFIVVTSAALAAVLTTDVIADGVWVQDVNLSGLTADEAGEEIAARYATPIDNIVTLKCGTAEKEIRLQDLACEVDVEATVNRAHALGKNGNIIDRIKEIFAIKKDGIILAPTLICDEVLLETYFGELAALIDNPGQEMHFSLTGEELTITRGIPGNFIDIPEAMETFKTTALLSADKPFVLTVKEMKPKEPSAQEIYNEISDEPVDAEYKIENQKLTIIDEKPGVSFDVAAAQAIIDQNPGDVITVPVTVIQPQVTAEQIKNNLFSDLLGTYTSKYNAGDVARSHNVSLAAKKIDGVVLAPGDVFSYNDTVGPRTAARGFRTATVYVGNRSEPGIGGGICQVSSTLFNAVVLADLNIVYRTNHSLPVSYVPLGRDATVSYGSIDFKFSNNTNHPVKIVASAAGGYNKISVYGIKENKNKTIEITTEQIASKNYNTVQTEDPTLPVGTVKVEEKGSYGSTHNTYKITKENGKVVKTEFLTKSTYLPADRIEIVGTMPVPSEAPAPEGDTPQTEGNNPEAGENTGDATEKTPAPSSAPIPIMPPNVEQTPADEPASSAAESSTAPEVPAETPAN